LKTFDEELPQSKDGSKCPPIFAQFSKEISASWAELVSLSKVSIKDKDKVKDVKMKEEPRP